MKLSDHGAITRKLRPLIDRAIFRDSLRRLWCDVNVIKCDYSKWLFESIHFCFRITALLPQLTHAVIYINKYQTTKEKKNECLWRTSSVNFSACTNGEDRVSDVRYVHYCSNCWHRLNRSGRFIYRKQLPLSWRVFVYHGESAIYVYIHVSVFNRAAIISQRAVFKEWSLLVVPSRSSRTLINREWAAYAFNALIYWARTDTYRWFSSASKFRWARYFFT